MVTVFTRMGFGVFEGGKAAFEYPNCFLPPPWGGGQGVGKERGDFDLVKALVDGGF